MTRSAPALRVALLQTAPRLGAVDANLAELNRRLRQVADADLAVAPELATHGYHLGDLDDPRPLPAADERLAGLGGHGPAVVAGFAEAHRHHRYNSAAIVDGERVAVQRKLYLPTYRDWEERKHFRPGGRLRCHDVRGARVAVLICNDLWQPPLPWLAAHGGAEVVVVIANSVESEAAVPVRKAWDLLLAHTAVALQTYAVFVNRSGVERGRRFWGGSCVVGPDGETLVRLGADEDRAVADLDLAALRALRRRWPLLQESRFDLVAGEAARLAAEEK
ncbi:carbon-nitrogen hydrolase [Actinomadura sp. NBRC 104412]|uniref:nitrilase-related carbon-nitrogen hydrolase n=1 Tax=Actinomadura sp. NBRC 104412 TaxID=3032203 RepID=UPI0024A36A26|nr:nitrilase-related carbon-nitrogen hydrolase [Actinomadura sp. NBRC 104412]GLZ04759.1 carbon-nitrogen hydrolase [Actinomadura sp. NBRC 104412]